MIYPFVKVTSSSSIYHLHALRWLRQIHLQLILDASFYYSDGDCCIRFFTWVHWQTLQRMKLNVFTHSWTTSLCALRWLTGLWWLPLQVFQNINLSIHSSDLYIAAFSVSLMLWSKWQDDKAFQIQVESKERYCMIHEVVDRLTAYLWHFY